MKDHHAVPGLTGILGGLTFLSTTTLYALAHGLTAVPEHNVILGLTQPVWFALWLLPFPLLFWTLLRATRLLNSGATRVSRTLLTGACVGFCLIYAGHAVLTIPYPGDWRTAPTEMIGFFTKQVGTVLFALGATGGALTAPRAARSVRRVVAALGLLGISFLILTAADASHGFISMLLPDLAIGLTWFWLGVTLWRHPAARPPAPTLQEPGLSGV